MREHTPNTEQTHPLGLNSQERTSPEVQGSTYLLMSWWEGRQSKHKQTEDDSNGGRWWWGGGGSFNNELKKQRTMEQTASFR